MLTLLSLNSPAPAVSSPILFTTDRTVGRDPHLLCPLLGIPEDRFVRPHQTHTACVYRIDEHFLSLPLEEREKELDGVDAVISDVRNVVIGISTADCIPVVIYDPVNRAAAAIHAGWRGTVAHIVSCTLRTMQALYGTVPSNCIAEIGPGISLDSFEVGDEVYDEFVRSGFPMDIIAKRYPSRFKGNASEQHCNTTNGANASEQHCKTTNGADASEQHCKTTNGADASERWHIDLKAANRHLLVSSGIPSDAITISPIDTFTDERFFSARREQHGSEKCGRLLTGFVL